MVSSTHGKYKASASHQRNAPTKKISAISEKVRVRAQELAQEVWEIERWKTSIASKIPPYLATLSRGTTLRKPNGVPDRIISIVHRCFAQACLEHEAINLNGQRADWYQETATAAQNHMQQNPS